MSKISTLFGGRPAMPDATVMTSLAAETPASDIPAIAELDTVATVAATTAPATSGTDAPVEAEPVLQPTAEAPIDISLDAGVRLGGEHESLRNQLLDAGRRISQFEEYKTAFANLVEPATQALRALEAEKATAIALKRRYDQTRALYDQLRKTAHEAETRLAIYTGENEQLRQEIEIARYESREAERNRAEFATDNVTARARVSDLERQLALETTRANSLNDDSQRSREQAVAAEAKSARLSAELNAARDKIRFLEGEVESLTRSLEHVSEQAERAAQRFADSEAALTATKSRLLQFEASAGDREAERDRMQAALESATTRHAREQERVQRQVDAVLARAGTAERLLGEARQLLVMRSEEARKSDQQAIEATYARERLEKRLADIDEVIAARDTEIAELKSSRDVLAERSTAIVNVLKLRETQLARADEKIRGAMDRVVRTTADLNEARAAADERSDALLTMLERERLDHEVTRGALDAARKERADIQAELFRANSSLRHAEQANDAFDVKFPEKGANAA